MRYIFLFLSILYLNDLCAQNYSVSAIDDELLKGSNAVIRNYEQHVSIAEDGVSVRVVEHLVVTVLNTKGESMGRFSSQFGSAKKTDKLYGLIYGANGKVVQKIKRQNFGSRNASLASGHYDDAILWYYNPSGLKPPYTVEYNSEYSYAHTFYIPYFAPLEDEECAVEHAVFTCKVGNNTKIKYKHFGYDNASWPRIIDGNDGEKEYQWEINNLKGLKNEPLSYHGCYLQGTVLLTLEQFSLGNYKGNMASWDGLSSFVYALNDNKDNVPKSIIDSVNRILGNETSIPKKVALLYSFLQQNTRYVAIEFGINGWQSLDAEYTANNKYGDCKALSYYMKGLLKAAGIQSNAVLVYAGERNEYEPISDFALPYFNHAILMVPQNPDTIWLECTSKDLPAGYLSDFTQNRDVLILARENGKLVRTPKYDTATNVVYRNARVQLENSKKLNVEVVNTYFGTPAIELLLHTRGKSNTELDKYANEKFNVSSYEVKKCTYESVPNERNVQMRERIEMDVNGMLNTVQDYILVNYDVLPLNVKEIEQPGERVNRFKLSTTLNVVDSIYVKIPAGYNVQNIEDVYLNYSFGTYRKTVKNMGDSVLVARQFVERQGIYEPEMFSSYEKWLLSVEKDNRKTLVFVKNE